MTEPTLYPVVSGGLSTKPDSIVSMLLLLVKSPIFVQTLLLNPSGPPHEGAILAV
jgi:hypothetical protein